MRLSYANVVATLALFVALGAGAYAAVTLPKNSVTSVQVVDHSLRALDVKAGQIQTGEEGAIGEAGPKGINGIGGAFGGFGIKGVQGAQGADGPDGQARVYAGVTSQGQVLTNSKGLTTANITKGNAGEYCISGLPFTPRVTLAWPDILSNDLQPNVRAEVDTPSQGNGATTACKNAQAFVRIIYQTVTGAQGSETLVRTGQDHGFYLEIN